MGVVLLIFVLSLSLFFNFRNSKKLETIVNIFIFLLKISCQSKESPPLVQPHHFLKKYFIATIIAKLEELTPSSFSNGGRQTMWEIT